MDSRINALGAIAEQRLTYEELRNRAKPLKTGIPMLDSYLEGGITPGLYVLGAGPGQGKSTLALQLGEYISREEKVPVLYFSLEMTAERIAAKTMTMDSFRFARREGFPVNQFPSGQEAKERFFTASELFNPEKLEAMSEEKRCLLQQAQQRLSDNKNLYVIESSLSAREIRDTVKSFMVSRNSQPEEPVKKPLVIVDYLQILPPDPDIRSSLTDKQQVDLNLKVLRELVLEEIPLLVISSLKRGNYSGAVKSMRMDSFKETGGIEYSADFLLGLQFTACHNPGGCDPDAEKVKYPRDVEIMVLKQRYGPVDVAVPLWYYAEFDYMEQKPGEPEEAAKNQTAVMKTNSEAPRDLPEPDGSIEKAESTGQPEAPAPASGKKKRGSRKPEATAYINNTKIAYEIRNGHWKSGMTKRINVAGRGETPVYTEFTLEGQLTCFDCDVADALYSLHRNGRKEFILRHVLQALTGDEKQTLTGEKKKDLRASLERLTKARITIDCTGQLEKKPELKVEDKIVFAGAFLRLEEKGEADRYSFDDSDSSSSMPLYRYGEETGQMLAFPKRLLSVRPGDGRKLPDTAENIMIRRYLIRRLEVIRKGRAGAVHLRKVSYYSNRLGEDSGMLMTMGIRRENYGEARWQDKLRRTHKTVTQLLKGFQRCGYIGQCRETENVGVELSGNVTNPFTLDLEEKPE